MQDDGQIVLGDPARQVELAPLPRGAGPLRRLGRLRGCHRGEAFEYLPRRWDRALGRLQDRREPVRALGRGVALRRERAVELPDTGRVADLLVNQ